MVLTGESHAARPSSASIPSIYANVRARQDAEDRAAKTIGEELKGAPRGLPVRRGGLSALAVPQRPQRSDRSATMVAIKAQSKPQRSSTRRSRGLAPCLFYGSDAGLVAERAGSSRVCLPRAISQPARSFASTRRNSTTIPTAWPSSCRRCRCSADRKIVRAAAGRRVNAAALQTLLEGGTLAGVADRRGRQPAPRRRLRALFEKSPMPPRSPATPTRRATSPE